MSAIGTTARAVLLAAALLAAACGGEVVRDPAMLATTLASDPPTLNPVLAADATSSEVNRYIYESLLNRDNVTLKLKPWLAEGWEVSSDHLTYTFHLRPDVRWQDGVPLTADDVVYTFERIRDPKVDAANLRNYFKDVVDIEKVDERTVRFVYSKPYFKALEILGGATIIPKHLFDDGQEFNAHPANRQPVGTGPFRFVEWKTGRHLLLTRNEQYWGTKPALASVRFSIIPDAMVRFQLLKKTAVDLDAMRAIQWVRQTESPSFARNFTKHRYYLPNYAFVGWNMRGPFFSDRRVRIAMTMLVNREAILEKILLGQGEVVTSGFYRFGPEYDERIQPFPYSPELARALLAQAGWKDTDGDGILDKDGIPFRFTFLTAAGSPFGRSIGLILREDLAKVGIDLTIRQLEWATMLKLLSGRTFDAVLLSWSMPLIQDPYQLWHSTQSEKGSNFVGFQDPEADLLMEEARLEFDAERRAQIYKRFQRIIHEEQPYTFLFTLPSLTAVARRFENVQDYRLGLDPTEWTVGPWERLIEW